MNRYVERLHNGIIRENPTLALMLGMCPTLAVTTSAVNGLGMGISTAAVLILSNIIIASVRNVIPDGIRIPVYIAIDSTLVTITGLLLQAYVPDIYNALGVYIPLIVVNCIILGRAEAYASKNPVILSAFDGIGMGIGFTLGLTVIGAIRELSGRGTIFGWDIDKELLGGRYMPVSILVMAPGAFFVLAGVCAVKNRLIGTGEDTGKCSCADCGRCSGCNSCADKGV